MSYSDRIDVNVWMNDYLYPGYLDPVTTLAAEFEDAHPRYRIHITGHDFRQMPRKVAEAAQQGHAPDVAEYFYTAHQQARDTLAADGSSLFTSVEQAIGGRSEILGEPVVIDDIVPAARQYFVYDGDLTSMPMTASTTVLLANTTILERAGITELPRTWKDVTTACEAVAALPDRPAHGITWPNHGWFFQQSLAQKGPLLADNGNGRHGRARRVDLATPEALDYASWWRQLVKDGHYGYSGKVADWQGTFEAFAEQRVALAIITSVEVDTMLRAARQNGFTARAGRMPHNGSTRYAGNVIGGDSLWLASGLDEARRDGALAFMQFLINPRNAARWHKTNGRIPITTASVALLDDEGWFAEHPDLRVATEQLDDSDCSDAALGPVLGGQSGIFRAATDALHDVITSDADPTSWLTEATAAAQLCLDEYNRECTRPQHLRNPSTLDVAW